MAKDSSATAPPTALRDNAAEKQIASEMGWSGASLIGKTVTINAPRAEVYQFWRDLSHLPLFMENIERVDVLDDKRSHWVVKGPGEDSVEWDSEIIEEVDGAVIAWRSLDGADVENTGRVQFTDAPVGRGTYVSAVIAYEAPGGAVGKLIAMLFGADPRVQVNRALKRMKQWIETGEIATSTPQAASPRAD